MSSDLPDGWTWATLGEVGHYLNGRAFKAADWREQGRPIIRIQNLTGSSRHHNHYQGEVKDRHLVRDGDLLLSWAATLGVFVWRGEEAVLNQHIFKVESWIFKDFHRWLLQYVLDDLYRQAHGSGMVHITKGKFDTTSVPIPPLAEQERIVAAIEEHFSRLDAVESTLRKVLKRLHTLRATILVEGFHSNRGLPSHWNRTTIGKVAEVRGGIQKQPKRRPNKNPAPFLRVANVLRGELLLDEVHHIELFDGELERYRLQAGDLLVVEGNGSPQQIGRAASWVDEIADCVHQNHLIRVRPGPSLDPGYLALYWNAPHTASVLRDVASSTSGLYTLSTTKVKAIPIPLAPLPEQRRIAEEVDQQLEKHSRLEQSIRHALDRLRAVRRSVLAVAFSGQLVPQDPTDEPASVLLERIAASRMTKPKRQRVDA